MLKYVFPIALVLCLGTQLRGQVNLQESLRQIATAEGMEGGQSCAPQRIFKVVATFRNISCSRLSAILIKDWEKGNTADFRITNGNAVLEKPKVDYPANNEVKPLQDFMITIRVKIAVCRPFEMRANIYGSANEPPLQTILFDRLTAWKDRYGIQHETKYGYDKMGDTSMETIGGATIPHHVSLEKSGGKTRVKVDPTVSSADNLSFDTSNPKVATPTWFKVDRELEIAGGEEGEATIIAYDASRGLPACGRLKANVYNKVTARARICRLYDRDSPNTALKIDFSLRGKPESAFETINEKSYRRAVAALELSGSGAGLHAPYDSHGDANKGNRDGVLTILYDGNPSGPEYEIAKRYCPSSNGIVGMIIVREMVTFIKLGADLTAGISSTVRIRKRDATFLSYDPAKYNEANRTYWLGRGAGAEQVVFVGRTEPAAAPDYYDFTLKDPVVNGHNSASWTQGLQFPAAGWGGNYAAPAVIEEAGVSYNAARLNSPIGHERAHGPAMDLGDIGQDVNLMHFSVGDNHWELRFRDLNNFYQPDPPPPQPLKESQWQKIPRR